MDADAPSKGGRLQEAGLTAYRAALLVVALLVVVVVFIGLVVLMYDGHLGVEPLILFSGVILGYVLRSVHTVI